MLKGSYAPELKLLGADLSYKHWPLCGQSVISDGTLRAHKIAGTELITIDEQKLAEMRRHGEGDYPFECCGLMLGRFETAGQKVMIETYPISNAREEEARRNRFLIRPEELMRGEKYAREKGLDIVGFYHSHPDDRAVPSKYDLDHAWPGYSYVVVAVTRGQATDLRSWEMEPDRSHFNEEAIEQSV